MSFLVAALAVVVLIVYLYKFATYKPTNHPPPGPIRIPICGSYLHVLWENFKYPHLAFERLKSKFKSPVIGLYLGGLYTVVANDYESCKEVLTRPEFQGRVEAFPVQFRTFDQKLGLFANDGDAWSHLRRFTLRHLRDLGFARRTETYDGVLEEEARDMVNAITKECESGRSIQVPETFFTPFLNCIFFMLTGNRIHSKNSEIIEKIGKAGLKFTTSSNSTGRMLAILPSLRFIFPGWTGYKDLQQSSDEFERFMKTSFKEHEVSFDENALRDMIDVFLKNKTQFPHFTEKQLLITCIDFLFPNTAASVVLGFCVIYLILYPDVQLKCQKEIDCVVGQGRLPTLNDRPSLPYVEATLREVMRRQILNPLGLGHRTTEDTTLCGFDIPKDSFVLTNLWSLHMDEAVWGDPQNFRPERFLDEQGLLIKDQSMPFGAGKRVCAGETFIRQNMFVLLASVLQNFHLNEDTVVDFSQNRAGVAVIPQENLRVRFSPRQQVLSHA